MSTRFIWIVAAVLLFGVVGRVKAQERPTKHVVTPQGSAERAQDVHAVDVDQDSDMDVISASSGDGKVAWYENKDGKGGFSNQKIITEEAQVVESIDAGDIDGDGDQDIISATRQEP